MNITLNANNHLELVKTYGSRLQEIFGEQVIRLHLDIKADDVDIHQIMADIINIRNSYLNGETTDINDIKPSGELPQEIINEINRVEL